MVPRHQHSAVDRNRLKRRLKELARLELLPLLRACGTDGAADVAIRARREAYGAAPESLRQDILTIRDRTTSHHREETPADPAAGA